MSYKFLAKRKSLPNLKHNHTEERDDSDEKGVLHSWVVMGINSGKFKFKLMNFRSSPLPAQRHPKSDDKPQ
jgi:hypothetical protein